MASLKLGYLILQYLVHDDNERGEGGGGVWLEGGQQPGVEQVQGQQGADGPGGHRQGIVQAGHSPAAGQREGSNDVYFLIFKREVPWTKLLYLLKYMGYCTNNMNFGFAHQ